PGAVLVIEHAEAARLLPGSACDNHLLGDEPVRYAQLVCGVADADIDTVLGRSVKSPLLQPNRHASSAACGVDDEVGRHLLAGVKADAGHPLPGGVEARL